MKTAMIPVTHIPVGEYYAIQERLGFPVSSRSSSGQGSVVIVAPEHEQATRAELDRMGILRKPAAGK